MCRMGSDPGLYKEKERENDRFVYNGKRGILTPEAFCTHPRGLTFIKKKKENLSL